jgi:hypothetical protein
MARKQRHKQRHQEATTDDGGGINERAGDSGTEHAIEATHSSKHQAQPPMDHLEKLLEEIFLNHA